MSSARPGRGPRRRRALTSRAGVASGAVLAAHAPPAGFSTPSRVQQGPEGGGQTGGRDPGCARATRGGHLPVDVLTRALDEPRLAQTPRNEAGAVCLERLRLLGTLPRTARAPERVDIEAAMAELDAAHAGRPEAKTRQAAAGRRRTAVAAARERLPRQRRGPPAEQQAEAPARRSARSSATHARRWLGLTNDEVDELYEHYDNNERVILNEFRRCRDTERDDAGGERRPRRRRDGDRGRDRPGSTPRPTPTTRRR